MSEETLGLLQKMLHRSLQNLHLEEAHHLLQEMASKTCEKGKRW